ncbi:MAG TPA: flagellar protein export ATPase FliI [Holosporales bacterium]|nr:flagellar protein export ATPase FliI [Holosporales bacterium]
MMNLDNALQKIEPMHVYQIYGEVISLSGLSISVSMNTRSISVGTRCSIEGLDEHYIDAEVVGFSGNTAQLMAFGDLNQIRPGCRVIVHDEEGTYLYPDNSWCGRIINGLGKAFDEKGPLKKGEIPIPLKASPPPAHKRALVDERIDTGIRAINTFLTMCKGQRMGIFAGSGVGKTMLLSMMIKYAKCDVVVIGLIGERGRELNDFIEKAVGQENLQKCVLVVSTSDESALMRKQAAYTAMTVAEYFRNQGKSVLCVMDSVTRFAMAQREIGLSCGEPPASKGYTPSVFAELPKLLERAGPGPVHEGLKTGYITAVFTVLVDGDDHNEPIADAVRGILDGHIVLDRSIAARNHFPAIDILNSISRTVPGCHYGAERTVVSRARSILATYNDMADMIRIGAYKKGSSKIVDEAVDIIDNLNTFTSQSFDDGDTLACSFDKLAKVIGVDL